MSSGVKVFLRFLTSYLVIMLIPFGFVVHMCNQEMIRISDDIYDRDTLMLEQGQRAMEKIVGSMDSLLQSMMGNAQIKRLMNYDSVYSDLRLLTKFMAASDALAEFTLYENVDHLFLYAYKSDTVVGSNTLVYNAMANNQHVLLGNGYDEDAANRFRDIMLGESGYIFLSAIDIYPPGACSAVRCVPYVTTLTNSSNRVAGRAVLLLEEKLLLERLGYTLDNGWLYAAVENLDGTVLAEIGEPIYGGGYYNGELFDESDRGRTRVIVDGRTALVSYVTDRARGLRYVGASSADELDGMIWDTRVNVLIMLALIALIGMGCALLVTMRATAPLRRVLLGINSGSGSAAVDYTRMDEAVASIMNENATLKEEMGIQAPMLRGALTSRWIYGEYDSVDEIMDGYSRVGHDADRRLYAVITAEIPARRVGGLNPSDRALVKALLRENVPGLIDVVDVELDSIALIAGSPQRDKAAFRNALDARLDDVYRLLLNKTGLELTMLAAIAGDANRVHMAYMALKRSDDGGRNRGVNWLLTDMADAQTACFPVELELRIMDSIKNGDERELGGAMSRLYTENVVKRELNEEEFARLAAVLDAMFIRLDCAPLPRFAHADSGVEKLLAEVHKRLLALCGQQHAEHTSRQQELCLNIEKYVMQNFGNPSMSLTSVADALGYTQSYISRVFKQQTGELLSAYMERVRMEHAQELLKQNDMPIYKIAESCGYNSVQVFRRAFARVYGVSPSDYVRKCSADDEN